MATVNDQQQRSITRCDSPSPDTLPTPAIGAVPELSRCISTTSSMSQSSSSQDGASRDSSMNGDIAAPRSQSRPNRQSSHGHPGRRRGYMRPQVTDFAASAKSRESVMSLGSIAHLQYYFARTGLLDGKGGQLARKKKEGAATLDLAALDATGPVPKIVTDPDSSYSSMGSSPEFGAQSYGVSGVTESPIEDMDDHEDSFAESEPGMLPPTVSTYVHKEKVVPKPPTIDELKADLETSLSEASKAIREVQERKAGTFTEDPDAPKLPNMPDENTQSWYELQGMQILDVTTLAIRAAKMYYTAHELPDRLDSIKSEKQVRADLLAVMEVLKQQATRNFKGGMKNEEINVISGWIDSVWGILKREAEIEAAEQAERASWTWLDGDWTGREMERERAFLVSMDPEAEPLPPWTSVVHAREVPPAFLKEMQDGRRLVKLHNAVLKKSRRRFGAIPTFHDDVQKPYRRADNLRYWVKAAELRFEVLLSLDVMSVVNNTGPEAWKNFEDAILKWSTHVRQEITKELQ